MSDIFRVYTPCQQLYFHPQTSVCMYSIHPQTSISMYIWASNSIHPQTSVSMYVGDSKLIGLQCPAHHQYLLNHILQRFLKLCFYPKTVTVMVLTVTAIECQMR